MSRPDWRRQRSAVKIKQAAAKLRRSKRRHADVIRAGREFLEARGIPLGEGRVQTQIRPGLGVAFCMEATDFRDVFDDKGFEIVADPAMQTLDHRVVWVEHLGAHFLAMWPHGGPDRAPICHPSRWEEHAPNLALFPRTRPEQLQRSTRLPALAALANAPTDRALMTGDEIGAALGLTEATAFIEEHRLKTVGTGVIQGFGFSVELRARDFQRVFGGVGWAVSTMAKAKGAPLVRDYIRHLGVTFFADRPRRPTDICSCCGEPL